MRNGKRLILEQEDLHAIAANARPANSGDRNSGNFHPGIDVILFIGGIYARLWVLPFSILRIWLRPIFPAYYCRSAAREARQGFHLPYELLPGMEFDWMDRGPGLGMQE